MKIELKILNKELYDTYGIPKYATDGSAAIDLIASERVCLPPGGHNIVFTGLAFHIGSGNKDHSIYCTETVENQCEVDVLEYINLAAVILPRSSLGSKGLVLGNTIGLIDEDYQGEIVVCLWNRNTEDTIVLNKGDRFAQLMFIPVVKPKFVVVDNFTNSTKRGSGGFGSTGTN